MDSLQYYDAGSPRVSRAPCSPAGEGVEPYLRHRARCPVRGEPLPLPASRSSAMLASPVKGGGQSVAAVRPPTG